MKSGKTNKVKGEIPQLGRLRLLMALDTLLVEGSVSGAAKRLGLSDAATSRLLTQIRELFDDPIFVRSGRSMIATPRAESLRGRLRQLVNDVEGLTETRETQESQFSVQDDDGWQSMAASPAAPLTFQGHEKIESCTTAEQLLGHFEKVRADDDPISRLAKYIAITGRKTGQTRPLDADEAEDAFSIIFSGQANPMQISALLSLIHYRGETAAELAGMVISARNLFTSHGNITGVSLDWPCYLSPNSKQAPWFIQAAKLVARSGCRVVLHGSFGHGDRAGKLELAAKSLNIPIAGSYQEGAQALREQAIAYLPLRSIAPQLNALMALYPLFYSRSPINAAVPLLNPLSADASFLGTSQAIHRELHRDAGLLLDKQSMSIVTTNRDVAEIAPHRMHLVYRLVGGEKLDFLLPRHTETKVEKRANLSSYEYWKAVWTGAAVDERAIKTIISTAAIALMTARKVSNDHYPSLYQEAEVLWQNRHK